MFSCPHSYSTEDSLRKSEIIAKVETMCENEGHSLRSCRGYEKFLQDFQTLISLVTKGKSDCRLMADALQQSLNNFRSMCPSIQWDSTVAPLHNSSSFCELSRGSCGQVTDRLTASVQDDTASARTVDNSRVTLEDGTKVPVNLPRNIFQAFVRVKRLQTECTTPVITAVYSTVKQGICTEIVRPKSINATNLDEGHIYVFKTEPPEPPDSQYDTTAGIGISQRLEDLDCTNSKSITAEPISSDTISDGAKKKDCHESYHKGCNECNGSTIEQDSLSTVIPAPPLSLRPNEAERNTYEHLVGTTSSPPPTSPSPGPTEAEKSKSEDAPGTTSNKPSLSPSSSKRVQRSDSCQKQRNLKKSKAFRRRKYENFQLRRLSQEPKRTSKLEFNFQLKETPKPPVKQETSTASHNCNPNKETWNGPMDWDTRKQQAKARDKLRRRNSRNRRDNRSSSIHYKTSPPEYQEVQWVLRDSHLLSTAGDIGRDPQVHATDTVHRGLETALDTRISVPSISGMQDVADTALSYRPSLGMWDPHQRSHQNYGASTFPSPALQALLNPGYQNIIPSHLLVTKASGYGGSFFPPN